MGREFVDSIGDVVAEWSEHTLRFDPNDTGGCRGRRLDKDDIPAFIEWLRAGPPVPPPPPQYRITKLFEECPIDVYVASGVKVTLCTRDIEKIPCSG